VGHEPISLIRALCDEESLDRTIAFHVRAPRVALGAIAGGGLAASGSHSRRSCATRSPSRTSSACRVARRSRDARGDHGHQRGELRRRVARALAALAGGLVATATVYGLARSAGGTARRFCSRGSW